MVSIRKRAKRSLSLVGLLIFASFVVSGCDKLSEFVPSAKESEKSRQRSFLKSSVEPEELAAGSLFEILAEEEFVVQELITAFEAKNHEQVQELHRRFKDLEMVYSEEFQNREEQMSAGQGLEISQKHRDIVARLRKAFE